MKNIFKKGFTLVELIIAVTLFTVIASFSIGAVLSIFDAHRRAQSTKTVVDNLNLSIESMARNVRFGGSYYCGISSGLTSTSNCSNGGNALSITFNNTRIIYRWNGGINDPIQKSENGGSTYSDITSPDTKIQYLRFYVFDSDTGGEQPYVIAVIKGYVGNKATTQSSFTIQTLMSQRQLDI
ncbi:MAG: hypothetical protein A2431_01495 [Candidatus Zambryskibacteria bacterium RIFOXYC1_FULL_39_10]|uniref:Prepilin-type N-terminal cleavage/methylation domain-containing protein n=1 Tax=Candidatus Zambryskibacteria bacterium RIFOXYC1_FULL_39_10 TaxID=1802779 RepID=A0A1G2V402_9BACT|nr:MAG: hypothetical protein A2605_03235 [Candidatus Zambryskibacteria bacterium RIFOXYD1_FULL_39_35]OHB16353.1 MAG: hypothetical protein A2431_01495 [Candidatus Zambryskibacteria bacterium RIFOXYC1_FULL_39_10]